MRLGTRIAAFSAIGAGATFGVTSSIMEVDRPPVEACIETLHAEARGRLIEELPPICEDLAHLMVSNSVATTSFDGAENKRYLVPSGAELKARFEDDWQRKREFDHRLRNVLTLTAAAYGGTIAVAISLPNKKDVTEAPAQQSASAV